jgi:hypothetical protein
MFDTALHVLLLLATALLGWDQSREPPCKPQLAVLTTGTFSGGSKLPTWPKEDAGSWNGDGWVGWTHWGDSVDLVQLKVTDLPRQAGDDFDEVTVETVPRVDFAVRCLPSVRPGKLTVARHTGGAIVNEHLDSEQTRLVILLGARSYPLRLESTDKFHSDMEVLLTHAGDTQTLYSTDGFADEPFFDVVWAGDLDRDGKLDLLVNFSRKYSVHPYRLLLSSKASAGQLVGEAALFLSGE